MPKPLYPEHPLLIVDDEPDIIRGCEFMLRTGGITHVLACPDSTRVLETIAREDVAAVLLDLSMPGQTGEQLLPRIVERHPDVPVVIYTGANELDTAVRCMREGAFDYMVKPVEISRMVSGIRRALEWRELNREYSSFRRRVLGNELEHAEAFAAIVTEDPAMRSLFQYAETIARGVRPVLVTGETGVGKELMARALHALSGRSGEFVAVDVAGLDDTMFADTLFGHVRGAFTNADAARPGLIAQAAGGTLFLDEIGDLSLQSQVKLLRLLQDATYLPLGADAPRQTDARIVLATHRDLRAMRDAGQFRADLFYRLQSHHLHIPPLRERRGDLAVLLEHLLEKAAQSLGRRTPTPPPQLLALLATYSFPGNVREFEAMVYDAVSHHAGGVLSMARLEEAIARERAGAFPASGSADALSAVGSGTATGDTDSDTSPFAALPELPTLRECQRRLLAEALRRAGGNQTLAAKLLGITPSGISKALKRAREEEEEG